MRPVPLAITACFFITLGVAGFIALIVPITRPYMHPTWAVALSAINLVVTGLGLWRMRRWAVWFFILMWAFQGLLVFLTGATVSASSAIGLLLVSALFVIYRGRFT